jgi:hypothetical protein
MQVDSGVRAALSPSCSILLGFLFAGFGWTLNQELSVKVENWHFKLGIGPAARCYGHAWTIRSCTAPACNAYANPAFLPDYRGGSLGSHHCIYLHGDRHWPLRSFQAAEIQNYHERFLFAATLLTLLGPIAKWCFF